MSQDRSAPPFIWSLLWFTICLGGCETTTEHERISLWPILNSEKTREAKDDGERWTKENGSACLIAHWNNRQGVDKDGNLIERTAHSVIFPILDSTEEEDRDSKRSHGRVLILFDYDKRERK